MSAVPIGEGKVIGNYAILSRLGVGGMGSVYLAEHPLIGKKVALKVIHKELAGNKEVVTRFFNEARAVNKIGNEHIVEIHDFGQTPEGEHFFIMEYLEGITLAQALIQHGALGVQRALHIAAQISNGLAAAHTCGIIHRDLKPDNIMLMSRHGDPDFTKVLDFGLAKMFVDSAGQNLTAAGVVLGTPQYMSPEACESKKSIDHRADIYSMGVLLFQMLTGVLPFDGNGMGEVLVKQVTQPPPAPRGLNPQIPPSVEQIILRCLAKRPDDRFGTMKDLRDALLDPDRYLASGPPVVRSSSVMADPNEKTMFGGQAPAIPQQPGVPPAAGAPQGPPPGTGVAPGGNQRGFPLAAPPPSLPGVMPPAGAPYGAPAGTAGAAEKTAFFQQAPVIPQQGAPGMAPGGPGLMPGAPGVPVGPPPVGAAGSAAKTAFMDVSAPAGAFGGAPTMDAAYSEQQLADSRKRTAVPELNQPIPAANKTMFIGVPEGYSDKPPQKKWPVVVALGSVLAVVAAAVALLVWPGFLNSDETQTSAAPGSGESGAPVAAATADGGTAVVAKAPPAAAPIDAAVEPAMVTITLRTTPPGAEIYDATGKLFGTSPYALVLPKDGKRHELTIKHPKAKTRTKTVIASRDTSVNIELELAPAPAVAKKPSKRPSRHHHRKKPRSRKPKPKGPKKPSGPTTLAPSFD